MNNELKNSINYLKGKTHNSSGFSIPNNYLDGIEDDFFLKLKEEQLPKSTSFDVPDTYFDTIETEILNKITNPLKKGKVISFKNKFHKLIPVAVAASLLIFITTQFYNNEKKNISFDELSYIEVENWFNENTIYTETELVYSFEDDIEYNAIAMTNENINDDAIEDYLNSIDESNLINEIQ